MTITYIPSVRQEGSLFIADTGFKDSLGNPIELKIDQSLINALPTQADLERLGQVATHELQEMQQALPSTATSAIVAEILIVHFTVMNYCNNMNPIAPDIYQTSVVVGLSAIAGALVTGVQKGGEYTESFLKNVIADLAASRLPTVIREEFVTKVLIEIGDGGLSCWIFSMIPLLTPVTLDICRIDKPFFLLVP